MMVTGLGAAVSDALDDGRVVSGVGGQYNFVAMAHALPEARSILCVRATRESRGEVTSSIPWSYGHATIPRHLRDIVVTEYGIADLRGRTDREVVEALLAIMDSRFQDALRRRRAARGQAAARLSRSGCCAQQHPQPAARTFRAVARARAVRGPAVRQRLHAGRGRARRRRCAGCRLRLIRGPARSAPRCGRCSRTRPRRGCSRTWPGWS